MSGDTMGARDMNAGLTLQQSFTDVLSPGKVHYWYSIYFPCAIACLNTVLKHSEPAAADYSRIVEAWNRPEYEVLAQGLTDYLVEHLDRNSTRFDAIMLMPELVEHGRNVDDRAIAEMRRMIGNFIERHFNPERRRPKITLEHSTFLGRVIAVATINDNVKTDPAELERWANAGAEEAMKVAKPTKKEHRELHSKLSKAARSAHFELVHNDTLLRWAEIWYLVRIRPGKMADALNELASDQHLDLWDKRLSINGVNDKYIRDRIYDYDKATGRIVGLP